MMTLTEKTLCVSFEARMPEAQGAMNLCFPAVGVECDSAAADCGGWPAAATIEGGADEDAGADGRGEGGRGAAVSSDAVAGEELAALAPGAVLRLPLARHAEAELRVGGLAVWTGASGEEGEHRGAQLEALNGGGYAMAAVASVN